jgi:hypothetical protein
MATFSELVFIMSLVISIGIFLYKLFNALSGFMLYDFKLSLVLWVSCLISFGLSFLIAITSYDDIIINQMFKFLLLPLGMITLLTIVEIFKTMQTAAISTQRGRYDPSKVNDLRAKF